MLDNVGLRYPHRASGAKAPRTLRPLPLLRFAVSATGGAHLCSIQYYLRFWLGICRTSLAVSALRILRYCLNLTAGCKNGHPPCRAASLRCCYSFYYIICFARVNGYFDDYYAGISSLLFTHFLCRFFLSILLHFIQAFPLTCLHSHLLSQALSEIKKCRIFPFLSCTPKKAAASNLPAAAYLIIIALPDYPLRFISITLRCHPEYLPQKHPSSFRCATYLYHLFPWRQPSAVVPGRSLWCRSGSARVLQ